MDGVEQMGQAGEGEDVRRRLAGRSQNDGIQMC